MSAKYEQIDFLESTSSAEVFPAKICLLRVEGRDFVGFALDFGSSSSAPFATFDRVLSSWKTSRLSLFEDSTLSSRDWPRHGTMQSGGCFPLRAWERRTSVNVSSSSLGTPVLPTPTPREYGSARGGDMGREGQPWRPSLWVMAREGQLPMLPTPRGQSPTGGGSGLDGGAWARERLRSISLLPTPTRGDAKSSGSRVGNPNTNAHPGVTLTDVVVRGQRLPTPTANDAKNNTFPESQSKMDTLAGELTRQGARLTGGTLHPRFIEAMMGLRRGWTDLEDDDVED